MFVYSLKVAFRWDLHLTATDYAIVPIVDIFRVELFELERPEEAWESLSSKGERNRFQDHTLESISLQEVWSN